MVENKKILNHQQYLWRPLFLWILWSVLQCPPCTTRYHLVHETQTDWQKTCRSCCWARVGLVGSIGCRVIVTWAIPRISLPKMGRNNLANWHRPHCSLLNIGSFIAASEPEGGSKQDHFQLDSSHHHLGPLVMTCGVLRTKCFWKRGQVIICILSLKKKLSGPSKTTFPKRI